MRGKLAESGVEKALNFSRSVYEVASQAQAELGKLFEESLSAYTKDMVNVIEKTTKSVPAVRAGSRCAQIHGCGNPSRD